MDISLPTASLDWLTDDVREKLNAIRGPHVVKKRITIIKIAFAQVNQQPLSEIFGQPDTCSETIWYTKWRKNPLIQQALQACHKRALEWNDKKTIALETHYQQIYRRSAAQGIAEAPSALTDIMHDTVQKGGDRIAAAKSLLSLNPDVSLPSSSDGGDNTVNLNLFGLREDELDTIINNLQAATGHGPATQTKSPTDPNDGSGPAHLDHSASPDD